MGQGLGQRCRPGPPLPGGHPDLTALLLEGAKLPCLAQPRPPINSQLYLPLLAGASLCAGWGFDFQPKIICELWAGRGAQPSCPDSGSEADAKP